jgi:hypothetical protein
LSKWSSLSKEERKKLKKKRKIARSIIAKKRDSPCEWCGFKFPPEEMKFVDQGKRTISSILDPGYLKIRLNNLMLLCRGCRKARKKKPDKASLAPRLAPSSAAKIDLKIRVELPEQIAPLWHHGEKYVEDIS